MPWYRIIPDTGGQNLGLAPKNQGAIPISGRSAIDATEANAKRFTPTRFYTKKRSAVDRGFGKDRKEVGRVLSRSNQKRLTLSLIHI